VAQVLAAREPTKVSGLILVEPTAFDIAALHARGYATLLHVYDVALRALSATGILRWYAGRFAERVLPPAYAAEAMNYELTPAAVRARTAESRGWLQSLADSDPDPIHLPTIPVTVLTATRAPRFAVNTHRQVGASHLRLTDTAVQGRRIEVDAGHNIHLTNPQAVVSAVADVIEICSQ